MNPALVLGGTGGIGFRIVERLVERGHEVVFTFFRARSVAAELETRVRCAKGRAVGVRVDLRSSGSLQEAVDRCGPELGAVVIASASGVWRSLPELSRRHVDHALQVNASSLVELFGLTLPLLTAGQGAMVALLSPGSGRVVPRYAGIGMSKGAADSFVRYAAAEAGPHGVRINGVSPGLVRTKALRNSPELAEHSDAIERATPLGRLAMADDIADVVLWLLSDDARMVTGQIITVDGGYGLV